MLFSSVFFLTELFQRLLFHQIPYLGFFPEIIHTLAEPEGSD